MTLSPSCVILRIAQILNAENNHHRELTEAERGRGIQTMLSLGVPVADAAVSADIPEDKAESYVRGTKVIPVDAVNLDFEAVALMGDYDDVPPRTTWWPCSPRTEEHDWHKFDDMLRSLDASMPEELRLGEVLGLMEIPVSDVRLDDEVWLYDGVYGKWESFPVVGFGQPEFNRIAVEVDAPNGRREVTHPDLPYVAK